MSDKHTGAHAKRKLNRILHGKGEGTHIRTLTVGNGNVKTVSIVEGMAARALNDHAYASQCGAVRVIMKDGKRVDEKEKT